jgi:hypothetical protein
VRSGLLFNLLCFPIVRTGRWSTAQSMGSKRPRALCLLLLAACHTAAQDVIDHNSSTLTIKPMQGSLRVLDAIASLAPVTAVTDRRAVDRQTAAARRWSTSWSSRQSSGQQRSCGALCAAQTALDATAAAGKVVKGLIKQVLAASCGMLAGEQCRPAGSNQLRRQHQRAPAAQRDTVGGRHSGAKVPICQWRADLGVCWLGREYLLAVLPAPDSYVAK